MEALKFSPADIDELAEHFEAISHKVPLHPIASDKDYDFAVRALNALLDAGAADETHKLAPLADALGELEGVKKSWTLVARSSNGHHGRRSATCTDPQQVADVVPLLRYRSPSTKRKYPKAPRQLGRASVIPRNSCKRQ